MTVGGAAAGSRFSHLQFELIGGATPLNGNAAVGVTTPATFEDDVFTLSAFIGTPARSRAVLVDLPPDRRLRWSCAARPSTQTAAWAGHDGTGLLERCTGPYGFATSS